MNLDFEISSQLGWPSYSTLTSAYFSQLFLTCSVRNTMVSYSNHLATIITLNQVSCSSGSLRPKSKRFEPHWIKDEECVDFFNKLWLPDSSLLQILLEQTLFWITFWNGVERSMATSLTVLKGPG